MWQSQSLIDVVHAFAEYLLNRLMNSGSEIQYRAGIQQSVEALIHLVNMVKFPVSDTV